MIAAPESLFAAFRRHDILDAVDAHLVRWLGDRARAAGVASEDMDALVWVAATLCRECADGSLCLPLEPDALADALHRVILAVGSSTEDAPTPDAHALALRFLEAAEAQRFGAILGTLDAPQPLIRAFGKLYLHRNAFAARSIADALRTRAAIESPYSPETRAAVLREILTQTPMRGPDGQPMKLTVGQLAALTEALGASVFVLAGGPGTGKTTWTAAWLRAILRLPGVTADRVRLCAPTGRAARRLEESIRATLADCSDDPRDRAAASMPVTTVHTMLGWRAFEGRYARNPDDPLEADWVMLDEASMADVFLMCALVRALRPGTRIVLAGDPGQLPAVEAGAVLGELLPETDGENTGSSRPLPSVTLEVSHRATGDVIPLASAVRRGETDTVVHLLGAPLAPAEAFISHTPARTIVRVEPGLQPAHTLRALLKAYAEAQFGARTVELLNRFRTLTVEEELSALEALWERAGRARVLSPLRRGAISGEAANRILRDLLEPEWRRRGDTPGVGFHGAPLLVTRNDARTGLSNGELGLWLESSTGAAVYFPRPELPERWLRLPVALLPACEPGFASTVHKSQGSECDEVLVLLPEAGNRLLARETLYTAITRARRAVRVLGTEEAIREAVDRKLRRPGGLRAMLRN